MDLVSQTAAALGAPRALRAVRCGPDPASDPVLTVARWRHGDAEVEAAGGDALVVVLNLSDTQRVERRARDRWASAPSRVGSVTVVDPQAATRFAVRGRADVLQLFLPLAVLAEVASELGAAPVVRPRFQASDPEIERCGLGALAAVRDAAGSPMVGDDLRLADLAYRLARRLTEPPEVPGGRPDDGPARGGLSRRARRRVEEVIAARLAASEMGPAAAALTLRDLADAADLSAYHFAREFRRATGETPHAYVLRRRLELARRLLVAPRASVRDVARRAGLASPAHFVARFRRHMGVTPGAFRDAVRG